MTLTFWDIRSSSVCVYKGKLCEMHCTQEGGILWYERKPPEAFIRTLSLTGYQSTHSLFMRPITADFSNLYYKLLIYMYMFHKPQTIQLFIMPVANGLHPICPVPKVWFCGERCQTYVYTIQTKNTMKLQVPEVFMSNHSESPIWSAKFSNILLKATAADPLNYTSICDLCQSPTGYSWRNLILSCDSALLLRWVHCPLSYFGTFHSKRFTHSETRPNKQG